MSQTKAQLLDNIKDNVQLDARNSLRFADTDSSHYVAFKAPATVSSNVTWTLPAADGSANYVLATDGSGTLSWIADPAGQWTTSSSDIYFTGGNVGIGDSSPSNPLSVTGASAFNGDVTFTGASYNVVWDKSDNALEFADNAKATFGTGADLSVYHDGSNSYLKDSGTGALRIQTNHLDIINAANNEQLAKFVEDGAVELYHNGLKKLETQVNGVNITSASNDAELKIISTNQDGAALIRFASDDGDDNADYWRIRSDGGGTALSIQNYASGSWESNIVCREDGNVELRYDNSNKMETSSAGISVTGQAIATGSSAKWETVESGGSSVHIQSGGSVGYAGTTSNHPLVVRTNNTERLRVDTSGRLLINNTASNTMWGYGQGNLQLTGDYQEASASFINDESNANSHAITLAKIRGSSVVQSGDVCGSIAWNGYDGSAYRPTARIMGVVDGTPGSSDMPGRLVFETTADGGSTPSERMRIDWTGWMGVGETSRGNSGQVAAFKNTSSANSWLSVNVNNNTGTGGIVFGDSDSWAPAYIQVNHSTNNMEFINNGAQSLTINSSGRVGIGETSPSVLLNLKGTADGGATGIKIVADADTYSQLTLDGDRSSAENACGIIAGRWNGNDVCSIYLTAGNDTTNKDDGQIHFYTRPNSGTSPSRRLKFTESGVWYGSLYDTNTNAGLSANIFVFSNDSMGRASSSGKYKKNIETIQDSYADKILTMRPTWYQQDETTVNIPEDQGDNWGYWGFIAEEVAAIDPRLVTWKVANYATDPNDQTKTIRTPLSEPEPDNVAYDRFVPHFVNLLKRQSDQIKTLETKVAALESA